MAVGVGVAEGVGVGVLVGVADGVIVLVGVRLGVGVKVAIKPSSLNVLQPVMANEATTRIARREIFLVIARRSCHVRF